MRFGTIYSDMFVEDCENVIFARGLETNLHLLKMPWRWWRFRNADDCLRTWWDSGAKLIHHRWEIALPSPLRIPQCGSNRPDKGHNAAANLQRTKNHRANNNCASANFGLKGASLGVLLFQILWKFSGQVGFPVFDGGVSRGQSGTAAVSDFVEVLCPSRVSGFGSTLAETYFRISGEPWLINGPRRRTVGDIWTLK